VRRGPSLITTSAPASRSAAAHRVALPRKNGSSVPATRLAAAADASSFAASAATLAVLRTSGPEPATPAAKRRMSTEIVEGLRYVAGHEILRRIVACTATSNLFNGVWTSVLVLFLVHDLHASAAQIGLAFSLGSLGGLVGGFIASWLHRRFGSARMLWIGRAGLGWMLLAIPLARPGWGLVLVSVGQFVGSISAMTYNIAQVSYRQSVTPPHLLGRMNASVRWVIWGTLPVGALLGGWLGTRHRRACGGIHRRAWCLARGAVDRVVAAREAA